MPIWHYHVTTAELTENLQNELQSSMDEKGKYGWELVSVTPITLPGGVTSSKAQLVYKKPRQESPTPGIRT